MAHYYINKSALVAEIKERIETYNKGYANGDDRRADALEVLLHVIDTLEVKYIPQGNDIELSEAVRHELEIANTLPLGSTPSGIKQKAMDCNSRQKKRCSCKNEGVKDLNVRK